MNEVTKEDINRIYDKLEPMASDISSIKADLRYRPVYERPCEGLKEHLQSHKAKETVWNSTWVQACVDIVKIAIVSLVTFFFVTKKNS